MKLRYKTRVVAEKKSKFYTTFPPLITCNFLLLFLHSLTNFLSWWGYLYALLATHKLLPIFFLFIPEYKVLSKPLSIRIDLSQSAYPEAFNILFIEL